MPTPSTQNSPPQDPYIVPDCDCGAKECFGPEPVPWLPWKHCFKVYEFRTSAIAVDKAGLAEYHISRLPIRVRYEHALCLQGRKQGPIIHTLTLLPKEQIRIYESDRYRRATSATDRFSARTSFFAMTERVNDIYSGTKTNAGGATSVSTSASAGGGGGFNFFGLADASAEASASMSANVSAYFDVTRVSEQFSHVAETSSLAVETERSIVVSTFEDQESLHSTARTFQNDNACRAVTYFIRRVFEVYQLTTRIVGIDVLIAGQWMDFHSLPKGGLIDIVRKALDKMDIGAGHDPRVEISLPTDGLLYEAELAHCCSSECEREVKTRLETERMQLENLNLRLEASRRQKRLDAGELEAFEELPPESGEE